MNGVTKGPAPSSETYGTILAQWYYPGLIPIMRIHFFQSWDVRMRFEHYDRFAMTTASKVTRHYFFPKENETIHEVLKDLMESSIATVCRKRNIFPQRIFHSVCTHDLEMLKFRREESFSKNENFENESQISLSPLSWTGSLKTWVQEESSGARYSTQIYSKTMILDWLQNEAFTNLGDFPTTKIFLGIARNLDDKILEEYEVSKLRTESQSYILVVPS